MYTEARSQQIESLIHRHAPLVKRIAQHLLARLPDSVQLDDLIQSGMIGLIEAAQKYDAGKGATFETYAGIRIRGAMMDEIRKGDWVPRSVHRNARKIAETIKQLEDRLGREARDSEIADALDMTPEEYHKICRDSMSGRLFSYEEVIEQGEVQVDHATASAGDPLVDTLHKDAFRKKLAEAIAGLPEKEKLVLSLYYTEELNLKEIGQILSVSESRVSQIHGQATMRLRARLADWR